MSSEPEAPSPQQSAAPAEQPADAPEDKRETALQRAKRGYDYFDTASTWADRLQSWPGYLDKLMALAKANTAATAATATVATGAATAGVVAVVKPDLIPSFFEPPPAVETRAMPGEDAPTGFTVARIDAFPSPGPVIVETLRWGEAVVFPIDGVDGEGRRAAFEVAALPARYAWTRGSADSLTVGEEELDDEAVASRVFAPALRAGLARAQALIAVGVASQEGRRSIETRRAGRRAATAAGWLTEFVSAEAPLYTLNLGQYQEESCAAENADGAAWQRPVLFIGVKEADDGVDLAAALTAAMEGKANLPDRTCYSAFAFEPAR